MTSIYCKPSQVDIIKFQHPDLHPIFADDGTMLTTSNKKKSKSCTIVITLAGLYFYRIKKHEAELKEFFSIYDIQTIKFIDPKKSQIISNNDVTETFSSNHMDDALSKLTSALSLLTGNFRDHPNITFEGFPMEPRVTSLPVDHLNLSIMRYICLCIYYKRFNHFVDGSPNEPIIEIIKNIETTPNQMLTLSPEVTGLSILQAIAEPISFIDNITTVRFINFIPCSVFNLAHYFLKHSKSIRTIIFENYNFLIPYQLDLEKLTDVNTPISFIFNNCNIDQESTLSLFEELAKYPGEYQRLSFNQLSLNSQTCSSLFENLTKSRAARTLEYFEMTQIDQEGDIVETFNNGVQSLLRHCRSLYYTSFSFTQDDIPLQFDPFLDHYILSEIVLTKQNYTQPFSESLDLPPQLHYLDFRQSKFSSASLQSLFNLISKHENPLSLSLAQIDLSESFWMQFYDALPTLPTLRCLRELNWSGNKIKAQSMEQFVRYFIKQTPIRYLSIDYIFGISQMDDFKSLLSFIPENKLWGLSIKGNAQFNFSSNFPQFLAAIKAALPIHFLNLDGQLIREEDFPKLIQFLKENECIIGLSCDDIQNKQSDTFFSFYSSLFSTKLRIIGRPMVDIKEIFKENSILKDKLYENIQWQTFRQNIRTKYDFSSSAMRACYICRINPEEDFNIQHYIDFVTTYPKAYVPLNSIHSYGLDFISQSNGMLSIYEINNNKPFINLSTIQNKNLADPMEPPHAKKSLLPEGSQIDFSSFTTSTLDTVSKPAQLGNISFEKEVIADGWEDQKEEIYVENDHNRQPFTKQSSDSAFQGLKPISGEQNEIPNQQNNETPTPSPEEHSSERDAVMDEAKQQTSHEDGLNNQVQHNIQNQNEVAHQDNSLSQSNSTDFQKLDEQPSPLLNPPPAQSPSHNPPALGSRPMNRSQSDGNFINPQNGPRQPGQGQRPMGPQGQRPMGPQGQYPPGQRPMGPPGQYPPGQYPPGQRPMGPPGQRPMGPQGQYPPGQRPMGPPGQNSPGQRPMGPPGQYPPGQRPMGPQGQYPPGQRPMGPPGQRPMGPQGQYPPGQRPMGPPGQNSPGQRPMGPPGQYPPSQRPMGPQGQYPPGQRPPYQGQPGQRQMHGSPSQQPIGPQGPMPLAPSQSYENMIRTEIPPPLETVERKVTVQQGSNSDEEIIIEETVVHHQQVITHHQQTITHEERIVSGDGEQQTIMHQQIVTHQQTVTHQEHTITQDGSQPAIGYQDDEAQRKLAEEQERLRREAEEQERLRREAEEQERLRREAEEQERLRREAEEQERLRREAEEQERLRRQAEEQERLRREAEDEEARRARDEQLARQAAEYEQRRAQEEALRKQRQEEELRRKAEEDERRRRAEEEERRRRAEEEEFERQREAEEAIARQKAQETIAKQRALEEQLAKERAEEEARQNQLREEELARQREKEEAERRRAQEEAAKQREKEEEERRRQEEEALRQRNLKEFERQRAEEEAQARLRAQREEEARQQEQARLALLLQPKNKGPMGIVTRKVRRTINIPSAAGELNLLRLTENPSAMPLNPAPRSAFEMDGKEVPIPTPTPISIAGVKPRASFEMPEVEDVLTFATKSSGPSSQIIQYVVPEAYSTLDQVYGNQPSFILLNPSTPQSVQQMKHPLQNRVKVPPPQVAILGIPEEW